MYQRLSLVPIGFPILDDLRLQLLVQKEANRRRVVAIEKILAFMEKPLEARGLKPQESCVTFQSVDRFGTQTYTYFGGTFNLEFEVMFRGSASKPVVVGVEHIAPEYLGIVALISKDDLKSN